MLAPNEEFVYRPMTVREPFAFAPPAATRWRRSSPTPAPSCCAGELDYIEPEQARDSHQGRQAIEYDALVLALGARAVPRYGHAITIDDRRMDETLHGLIEDIEGGYVDSLAFVSPAGWRGSCRSMSSR